MYFRDTMGDNVSAILEGLNSEQKNAVSCVDGPVLIVAGAGSGKTRVLTSRIAYVIAQGCDPSRILSLTFTKKAASEMKERVANMVGGRNAWKIQMGTFHSVFIRFLRDYSDYLGYPKEFTVYDQSDSTSMVKSCIKELQLDDKIYKPKDVLARISSAKNSLVSPSAYRSNPKVLDSDMAAKKPKLGEIYQKYWEKCRQAGVMDFDDILFNMNILLKNFPDAKEEIASRFDYVMVDEYQDTNRAQYLILKQLSEKHRNLCVVGDDSQSIYAFRGARIENILGFRNDYPEAKVFRLEQNYRSTQVIVDAANSLIEKNENRIPKKCFSEGSEGELIRLIEGYTDKEEAVLVTSSIIERIHSSKAQYQDFAILYRTNSQSRQLEEQLRLRNIPYQIFSGNSFFDRMEVKDSMAYFKLVVNPRDDESFKRVINVPVRGIGDTSVAALSKAAAELGCPLSQAIYAPEIDKYFGRTAVIPKIREFCDFILKKSMAASSTDAYALACQILNESGYSADLKKDLSVEGQSRVANVDELLNSVKSFVEDRHNDDFEEMQIRAYESGNELPENFQITDAELPVVTLGAFLENISLLSAVDVKEEEGEDANNKVALMTVHSSKGLEFPYVFVVGMEENLFPSGGTLISPAEVQEERRLFYVAMTRAKTALTLSFAKSRMRNGKTETNSPSRFVREIGRKYIKNPLPDGAEEMGARSAGFSTYRSSNMYGGSFSRDSGKAKTEPRKPMQAKPAASAPVKPKISQPLRPIKPAPAAVVDFLPSPVAEFKIGKRVQHNRFGFGKIVGLSGDAVDLKATVLFDNFGEKILILKYAKMRVVNE